MNFYKVSSIKYKFLQTIRTYTRSFLDISDEVITALNNNTPVVALETAILTHGMPYPTNIKTAQSLEKLIRVQGAVPATIGVLKGKIKIGLDEDSLFTLASPETSKVKVSRCDFPYVLSKGLNGGTTVAGTLIAARLAGISIFVTGGIGGVHRDVQDTMDISADLFEISRSPIMVVCSGIKSILDIGKTLEYLETVGVCTVVYGENKCFPSFYSNKSDYKSLYNITDCSEAADLLYNVQVTNLQSGILLAVPIPAEFSIDNEEIECAIQEALKLAKEKSIRGKSVTPFLLDCVGNVTSKRSLASNVALIENNAKIGSRIAVCLQEKYKKYGLLRTSSSTKETDISRRTFSTMARGHPVVIGGSIMDFVVKSNEPLQMNGATLAGTINYNAGGVGRNIADALGKLMPEKRPIFISAIGDDEIGHFLLNSLQHIDRSRIKIIKEQPSCTIFVLLDENGDCPLLVGNLSIHRMISPSLVQAADIEQSSMVVIDGNLPEETMDYVLNLSHNLKTPVWFEPTGIMQAVKAFSNINTNKFVTYTSPNFKELQKIAELLTGSLIRDVSVETNDLHTILEEARYLTVKVLDFVSNIMTTLGPYGVLMAHRNNQETTLTFYRTRHKSKLSINNVSGAGDCLAAGYIASMLRGLSRNQCMRIGTLCALNSLQSQFSVPEHLLNESIDFELISTTIPITGRIDKVL